MKGSVLAFSAGLVGTALFHTTPARAVVPPYQRTYIGAVPGTTSPPSGGLAFLPADPNTLLITHPGGQINPAGGTIRAYGVTRDASNQVTGFTGSSTLFAAAPGLTNNSLAFGPGGVLFFGAGSSVGQIKPGSASPDKVVDLSALGGYLFEPGSAVTEVVSPPGSPGKANLIVHYNSVAANFYEATLTPDGAGTYDFSAPTFTQFVGGVVNLDHAPAGLPNLPPSAAFTTLGSGGIDVLALDANGRPNGFSSMDSTTAGGATFDPLTGDFLFVHRGLEPGIHRISAVPEPATAGLLALAASAPLIARRRRGAR